MPHKNPIIPKQYLSQLHINGLSGRLLHIPANGAAAKKDLLWVYGHHSSLERIYGIAEDLAQYGNVTIPDLPGFGGMDSLYKIGEKPDIDTMADYLAAVIRLRFAKHKKFTIAGFSYGFLVVTRLLQKYPDLAQQVDEVISVAGFTHFQDFKIPPRRLKFYKLCARLCDSSAISWVMRYAIFNSLWLRLFYASTPNAKHKFQHLSKDEFKRMIAFDIELWHNNDMHTYARTSLSMFSANLTAERVEKNVLHVAVSSDQYFDVHSVEQHMRCIYRDFKQYQAVLPAHMPSLLATKEESRPLMPEALRRHLARS